MPHAGLIAFSSWLVMDRFIQVPMYAELHDDHVDVRNNFLTWTSSCDFDPHHFNQTAPESDLDSLSNSGISSKKW